MTSHPFWLFASAVLSTAASAQTITHRWSFNGSGPTANGTTIADSIAGASGTIVGTGATRASNALTLPGGTNGNQAATSIAAYFDLPNGIVSSKTNLTIEIWATIVSARDWQRLFDFGRVDVNANGGGEISNTGGAPGGTSSSDNLMLSVQRGNSLSQQRLVARLNGAGEIGNNNSVSLNPGTRYHFTVTFQSGVGANASTGGRLTWYLDGKFIGSVDTNFRLNQIEDVNNWLGRSQFSGDQNSNISYDEVRIYSAALPPVDVVASRKSGADAAMIPVTTADSATVKAGGKAGIPVLANDIGHALPSTVEITTQPSNGTASVQPDGRILYTHVNAAATTDTLSYRVRGGGGLSNISAVNIAIEQGPKIANPFINVPQNPPATALGLVNAFPVINENGGLVFNNPLCITSPPGDTTRLFVCEKGGNVKLVPDVTSPDPVATTFFNLPALLTSRGESINTGSECGLLGLAFHPRFASTAPDGNRYFYLFYSVNKGGSLYQRVSRFAALANLTAVDPAIPEQILIEQLDQAGNHNGGDIHFGPDGYLYISVGDEGDANDSFFNSQRINLDLFAGILRIDVDKHPTLSIEPNPHPSIPLDGGIARFSIPKTNPFVAPPNGDWNGLYNGSAVTGTVRTEFWATGLRNPWRMSFDPVTGVLWCADVGQGQREEVNKITRGGNYGWVFREGTITGARTTNPTMPPNFDTLYHSRPVYEYPRGGEMGGYSVTGGRVYRGTNLPSLTGKYIFGDYGSGNIWSLELDGTGVQRIAGEGGIAGFGYDPSNGDILIADLDNNRILRLANTTTGTTYPETLSATGLFADPSDLHPSPGVVPYDVNLPFWSDHAIKRRWVTIPDGTSQFTNSQDGLWSFPNGTVWVKHFDMEMQRGVSSSRKRIETRLIVKNPSGAYGVSYRWNDAGTEATLAADGGENFTLNVTDGGNPVPQTWRIPSRAECMICHTPQAGHALSFNTRQLNLENSLFGVSGNQLVALRNSGYLSNDPGPPNLLPRHVRPDDNSTTVEARVRSYLAVNCSYCHKAGGSAPTSWDVSAHVPLSATGIINATPVNSGNDPLNKLVVPGDTAHSVLLSRVTATNGYTRMPPVGSNVIDQANAQLLATWINGELENRRTYDAWRTENFEPDNDPSGAPDQDPDNDGMSNREEFLAGTDPLNSSSTFRPTLSGQSPLALGFTLPANRSFLIETSDNLGQWTPWDVPGNAGIPVTGNPLEFTIPTEESRRFFRIQLKEN